MKEMQDLITEEWMPSKPQLAFLSSVMTCEMSEGSVGERNKEKVFLSWRKSVKWVWSLEGMLLARVDPMLEK